MPSQDSLKNIKNGSFLTIHLSWCNNSGKSHCPRSNNARLTGYFLPSCAIPPTPPAWYVVEVVLSCECWSSLHHEQLFLHVPTANDMNDQLSDRWVFSDVIKELSRTMYEARHSFYSEFGLLSLSKYSQKVHLA